jgi:hypothetical protein
MDLWTALTLGAVLSVTIGLVIGSQGTAAGPLAIQLVSLADAKFYRSWPVFLLGSGLAWGMMLPQR